ncbi:amidohydrolase family protein [Kordiimonas pumila]|uniref:Amidohydrolase family protein n=1 Tax=Kordiimonas pumila TaxID=2161677 RepID=A0ABV7D338_9PROT|nr:amidohydrolase family protein [Kordiimonas pumila]
MKFVLVFASILLCFAGFEQSKSEDTAAKPALITITNVTIIDAINGIHENMTVTISGNKITNIVSSQSASTKTANQAIDGSGKYLIPGLWDMHVHLSFMPELEETIFPLFIANGVTSVRDTGGLIEKVLPYRDRSRREPETTPRVFISGPLLDGFPAVYDGNTPGLAKIAISLKTPDDAIKAVDYLNQQGVDFVKAYEMLSPETFKALAKRARKYDLKVDGHIPLSMTAEQAADAGMNSMEHLRNLQMACSFEEEALYKERQAILANTQNQTGAKLRSELHKLQHNRAINTPDEKKCNLIIQKLAEKHIWQIPTLGINTWSITGYYNDEEWRKTFIHLPEALQKEWATPLNISEEGKAKGAEMANWSFEMTQKLNKGNVGILAGTDTPLARLTPGYSLHMELELLVQAGLTPLEAIEAATIRPAAYFGLDNKIGTIEKGMIADLILLSANPLEKINNTQQIEMVIKNGHIMDREKLNNLFTVREEDSPLTGKLEGR